MFRRDGNKSTRSSHQVIEALQQRTGSEGRFGGFPSKVSKPQSLCTTSLHELQFVEENTEQESKYSSESKNDDEDVWNSGISRNSRKGE